MTRTRLTSVATACAATIALATLGAAAPARAATTATGRPTSNPGMARMGELMNAGNPGMAQMCELMLNGPGARVT